MPPRRRRFIPDLQPGWAGAPPWVHRTHTDELAELVAGLRTTVARLERRVAALEEGNDRLRGALEEARPSFRGSSRKVGGLGVTRGAATRVRTVRGGF